uniref:Uncharacterized protein n=1 Tax=Chromera velia CCMP2878 TaxID=1169474 RepID=A0A0G4G2G1_9ALVE|eukprot:Cvel_19963.t1-p1 / transcript=Cvel_19963.t1 / gene=Cvel_19963 / organism=Chromera_velia_CCMP2878 / gene_product=hypothetical protein / transcript_product=hypothetical protein / location=Cvel_scaffold1757:36447-36755(+) / protein_length=103 / sequence_SO=supercontig / SO=protein_coding / is_pseudo=false
MGAKCWKGANEILGSTQPKMREAKQDPLSSPLQPSSVSAETVEREESDPLRKFLEKTLKAGPKQMEFVQSWISHVLKSIPASEEEKSHGVAASAFLGVDGGDF